MNTIKYIFIGVLLSAIAVSELQLPDKHPLDETETKTFILDNGTRVIAQMDDEGNDGGVLACLTNKAEEILPVLGVEDEE